ILPRYSFRVYPRPMEARMRSDPAWIGRWVWGEKVSISEKRPVGFRCRVPRVRSEEPDSPDSPDPGYPPKQFGERDLPFLFSVGVHVLSQKDHLADAPLRQFPDLTNDFRGA